MSEIQKAPIMISVTKLHPFEGHPYKVKDDEEMNGLIESVLSQGILSPLIVRPLENTTDEYEIVSGHRRFRAAVKAGMEAVPAIIRPLSRDEAAIALVDSNLHREHILPSEKAFAYKLKMEALNHQGKRTDLTSDQLGPKLSSAQISESDSATQVKRYIRLTYLIPDILDLVDEGRIAFTTAVELSYLRENEQYDLLETIQSEDCTPSLSQAVQMKQLSQCGLLTMDEVFEIMTQPKGNQKEYLKLPSDKFARFFGSNATPRDKEAFIEKALEHYCRYLQRMRETNRDGSR